MTFDKKAWSKADFKKDKQKYYDAAKRFRERNKVKISIKRKEWYMNNVEREKAKSRAWCRKNLKLKRYGITMEQWQELFNTQKGCCAICSTHQSKLNHTLHVDHNHKTGKVRGLLCLKCNFAIGALQESSDLMYKAMEYLEENK